MEFSIPRDDHLLANMMRSIYNTHPWGECMIEVHEIKEFRRFGDDKFWDLKYKDVYRVDKNNKSGNRDKQEASAIIENNINPDSEFVNCDTMGGLNAKSPTIWQQSWKSKFCPKHGEVDLGKKGSKNGCISNGQASTIQSKNISRRQSLIIDDPKSLIKRDSFDLDILCIGDKKKEKKEKKHGDKKMDKNYSSKMINGS